MDRVMNVAHQEAKRLGSEYVGSEHLLLGIIQAGGVGAEVLKRLNVDVNRLYYDLEVIGARPTPVELPFSPRAKTIIEDAAKIAEQQGHVFDTGHLLFALISEKDGMGVQVLANQGLYPDKVGRMLDQYGSLKKIEPPPPPKTTSPKAQPLAMSFPPLPGPLLPELTPEALVFPPYTPALFGKRVVTQKEYDDEYARVHDLCHEKDDVAACEKMGAADDAQDLVMDISDALIEEHQIDTRWPLDELFEETSKRVLEGPAREGEPLRIGRIFDIDPSRPLEEQIIDLLFIVKPEQRAVIREDAAKAEVWDEAIYPSLYGVGLALTTLGVLEGFEDGQYWLDWSPDRSGIDIMYMPI